MLTAFDYAVLLVIGLSALRGCWRGLITEVFAIIGYLLAFIVAKHYVNMLAPYLPAHWPGGALTQFLCAFAVIFVGVLVTAGVLGALLSRITEASGLRSIDRSLGMLFGLARGAVLVLILVAVAQLTELPQYDFWRNGLFRPYVEQGVQTLKLFLPQKFAT